jgi:hypothetical protein
MKCSILFHLRKQEGIYRDFMTLILKILLCLLYGSIRKHYSTQFPMAKAVGHKL